MYECWTDGSYRSSEDCGGYSAIIVCDGVIEKKLYRGYKHTTNNRMEIMGVLACLKYFKNPEIITIYSDSQYVVNSINKNWIGKWISEKDESKKNMDLWTQVYELLQFHTVKCIWVKGHDANEMNNLADILAVHAGECLNLPEDDGYIDN